MNHNEPVGAILFTITPSENVKEPNWYVAMPQCLLNVTEDYVTQMVQSNQGKGKQHQAITFTYQTRKR